MNYTDCASCPDEHLNAITGHCRKYWGFYADVPECEHHPKQHEVVNQS